MRTVLCPIEFSDLDRHELEVALEVCRAFGARLVLHHNDVAISPGLARAWDWEATHHAQAAVGPDAERRMQALLAAIPSTVPVEACLTAGPIASTVLALAERIPADLIVLGSHGWSTSDHASVTERLLERSPCPVLTFSQHDGQQGFRLRAEPGTDALPVVVPTDLSASARPALAYACQLARVLPLRLHLLHVLPPGQALSEAAARMAGERLDAVIPPDLVAQVETHVRAGVAAEAILEHLREAAPAFAVLGAHARGLVRHLFTRDTTRQVAHRARCPVWVVPGSQSTDAPGTT